MKIKKIYKGMMWFSLYSYFFFPSIIFMIIVIIRIIIAVLGVDVIFYVYFSLLLNVFRIIYNVKYIFFLYCSIMKRLIVMAIRFELINCMAEIYECQAIRRFIPTNYLPFNDVVTS